MTTPDTRAEVERSWIDNQGDVWRLGDDGLMHTPETAPFPREHVERKWGPLREVAPADLSADTRPAEPAQGEREALDRVAAFVERCDAECSWVDNEGDPVPDTISQARDLYLHLSDVRTVLRLARTAPQPHPDTVETVEWGVRTPDGEDFNGEPEGLCWTREQAESAHENGDMFIRRTRVTTPDVVGPWEVVS